MQNFLKYMPVIKPKPNKYHKELKQALALLARIAEESGQYGTQKEAELKAVELLETFISNRI